MEPRKAFCLNLGISNIIAISISTGGIVYNNSLLMESGKTWFKNENLVSDQSISLLTPV